MNKQILKIGLAIFSIALLIILSFLISQESTQLHNDTVFVSSVIDGDTIKTSDNTRVRLIGIDAPEKGQCYYEESREFLKKLLEGKSILLEKDISGKDKYDRLLRYAVLEANEETEDNLLINDHIVRQGFARAIASPPDNRYRDLLSSAQEEAIRESRGIWTNCNYNDELSERRESNDTPPSPDHIIKGNISTRGYGKTYLFPGCDNYTTVKIDLSKGEQFFKTEKEAQAAGFRKATNCP